MSRISEMQDRIDQIEIDIQKAELKEDYETVARLEKELSRLEEKLNYL